MKALLGFIESYGGSAGKVLVVIGIICIALAYTVLNPSLEQVTGYIVQSAPVWLPILTFYLFFENWMLYVRKDFDLNQGRVTLEIRIPQEVFKSPEAMELVLMQLHQVATPDNHLQTYMDGKHPPVHSLELVSRAGDVRFYMNVPRKKFKNMAETQLYAQYPGIEVVELPLDYTAEIPWDPNRYAYFSIHFGLKKADAYPIKTYYEYGLHTMPKEEEKIDPISSMLDAIGNLGPGEFYWIQILIDANRKVTFKEGALSEEADWTSDAREEIKKIIDAAAKRAGMKSAEDGGGGNVMMALTDAEKETIKAIERSIGKNAFNTAIRGMYIAKKEAYNAGERIGALITGWRGYDDLNRNAIGVRWRTDVDWPWQDKGEKKRTAWKESEFYEYKKRTYTPMGGKVPAGKTFGGTQSDSPRVMTTEELATIFHIPGKVVYTPSLARIPSRRSEAPSNLPTG